MIGWVIALAVLAAIWFFPVGALLRYDDQGPRVKLILSLIRVQVYPWKKREKKKEKKKSSAPKQKSQPKAEKAPTESGGSLKDFLPLVPKVLDLLVDFRKSLRINRLEVHVVMAGGAPDRLAVNYGKAWAAIGSLDNELERLFTIRRKELDVQCDFCGSESTATARLEITITVGRLLRLGVRHGIRILPQLLNIQKLRKGGATQ